MLDIDSLYAILAVCAPVALVVSGLWLRARREHRRRADMWSNYHSK